MHILLLENRSWYMTLSPVRWNFWFVKRFRFWDIDSVVEHFDWSCIRYNLQVIWRLVYTLAMLKFSTCGQWDFALTLHQTEPFTLNTSYSWEYKGPFISPYLFLSFIWQICHFWLNVHVHSGFLGFTWFLEFKWRGSYASSSPIRIGILFAEWHYQWILTAVKCLWWRIGLLRCSSASLLEMLGCCGAAACARLLIGCWNSCCAAEHARPVIGCLKSCCE